MNDILITGGQVIDCVKDSDYVNPGILIKDGKIACIGKEALNAENCEKLDATGKTVMPGLIDTHVHLGSYTESLYQYDLPPSEFTALKGVKDAQAVMNAGFTTLRPLGGRGFSEYVIRDAFNSGMFDGPRLMVAGQPINVTGGLFDVYPPWLPIERGNARFILADGPVEILKAVRLVIKMGADIVKFEAAGASFNPYCPPEKPTMTIAEMQVICDEARRHDKRTAVHTECVNSIIDASNTGATTLEHAIFMTEEAAKVVKKNGNFVTPTLTVLLKRKEKMSGPLRSNYPQYMIERTERMSESALKMVKMCKDMGVKICAGSDMSVSTGIGFNAFEMVSYVKHCGFTPMEALLSATKVASEALGLESQIGTLEAGKCADIIFTKIDPLKEIEKMCDQENIVLVMRDGKIMKNI